MVYADRVTKHTNAWLLRRSSLTGQVSAHARVVDYGIDTNR